MPMNPRHAAARFLGSLGAVSMGFMQFWRDYNGIDRAVTEEGQYRLPDIEHFRKWLSDRSAPPGRMSYVYRNDGLVVVWGKVPGRWQLHVEVWQIYLGAQEAPQSRPPVETSDPTWPAYEGFYYPFYIGGKKPTELPGSQNEKIVVRTVQELPKGNMRKTFLLF